MHFNEYSCCDKPQCNDCVTHDNMSCGNEINYVANGAIATVWLEWQ